MRQCGLAQRLGGMGGMGDMGDIFNFNLDARAGRARLAPGAAAALGPERSARRAPRFAAAAGASVVCCSGGGGRGRHGGFGLVSLVH